MKRIARRDRKCQHDQRYDPNSMRWQKLVERKHESRHARQHGARQKGRGPAIESFCGKQPEDNDESREDPIKLNSTCTKVNIVIPKIMMSIPLAPYDLCCLARVGIMPASIRSFPSRTGNTAMFPPEPMRTLMFPRSRWTVISALAASPRAKLTMPPSWVKSLRGASQAAVAAKLAETTK